MKVAEKVANAIPPTNEGIDHGTWRDVTPPANIGSFAKSARSAILMTPLPGSAGTTLTDAAIKATQQVELKGMSIKEAFTQAQDTVNAQLAKDAPKKK
jgi:multiple sugar transport system substrate-binding protein